MLAQLGGWAPFVLTLGWILVGCVGMAIGLFLAIFVFDLCTWKVDEWELIKQGNIAMAIVLSAVIIAIAIVVASILSGAAL
ncbi:MAG: DUF350 domain-containing protein [Planctomycetota bacterium]|nr:DUF350 domain-containing protein [Planctomycetota bacterium]